MSVEAFFQVSRLMFLMGMIGAVISVILYVKLGIDKACQILFGIKPRNHAYSGKNKKVHTNISVQPDTRRLAGQDESSRKSKPLRQSEPSRQSIPSRQDEPSGTELLQDTQVLTGENGKRSVTKYEVTFIHTDEVI